MSLNFIYLLERFCLTLILFWAQGFHYLFSFYSVCAYISLFVPWDWCSESLCAPLQVHFPPALPAVPEGWPLQMTLTGPFVLWLPSGFSYQGDPAREWWEGRECRQEDLCSHFMPYGDGCVLDWRSELPSRHSPNDFCPVSLGTPTSPLPLRQLCHCTWGLLYAAHITVNILTTELFSNYQFEYATISSWEPD